MSFYGWKPYVSVAARRQKAEKAVAKAKKAGNHLSPVTASRGAITKTFWGKSWCANLERYSDFANRLPRGRSYLRNGSVIHLEITQGAVHAQVIGSRLYKVAVNVGAVPAKHWKSIGADCAGSIDSLVELLQGRFSSAVMERICHPSTGLFPAPPEIQFSCSCPDWADMCKHVAAVLYAVGVRLDEQPQLMFTLRRVDAGDLIRQAGAGLPSLARGAPSTGRVLAGAHLADVFGIEMADNSLAMKPISRRRASMKVDAAAKVPVTGATTKTRNPRTAKKTADTRKKRTTTMQKPPTAKVSAKRAVRPRKPITGKAAMGKRNR